VLVVGGVVISYARRICKKKKTTTTSTAGPVALQRTPTDLVLFGRTSSQFDQRNPMVHGRSIA
jgi:hypothetical protein